jgi:hypothetical protein
VRVIQETFEGGLLVARTIYEYEPPDPPAEAVRTPQGASEGDVREGVVIHGPWGPQSA